MTRIYEIRFTKEEAQAVVTLISRADIKGGEAPFVAALMNKIQNALSGPDCLEPSGASHGGLGNGKDGGCSE